MTFTPYLKHPKLLMTYPLNDQTEEILQKTGHNWEKPYAKDLKNVVYC